jgi:hypothetical protein
VLWFVPGVVLVVLAVPVVLAMRRCATEAVALRRSLGALADLRAPLAELRGDVESLRAGVPAVRGRSRPALPPAS